MNSRKPLRSSPLRPSSGGRRKQPKRDWREARAKVEQEGACRMAEVACPTTRGCDCGDECMYECWGPLEAAHVMGREHDKESGYRVLPDRIFPLCTNHHRAFDRHELDALPYLTPAEQLQAVRDAGGIALALRRISGRDYGERSAA